MLPRAARRRNVFHQLRQSTEQLALPWLCPATLRYHTQLNRPETTSNTSAASHSEHRRRSSVFQPARHLATATDAPPLSQTGGYVPFENFTYGAAAQAPSFERTESPEFAQSLYDEPAIMIQEGQMITSPMFRRLKGVGGTVEDLTARFTASITCGDLDMAALSLDRMSKFPHIDPDFFLDLHNTYLESVVDQMINTRRSDEALSKALAMQTWFEVKLPRGRTLQPDARTMAIMLRMALRMLHGSRRDRTVRRYWNMVVEKQFETEVIAMSDLLNDRDWGEISQLCPNQIPNDFVQSDSKSGSVDDLRQTDQKGLGLSSLQRTLAGISNDADSLDSDAAKQRRLQRQILLEKRAIETAQQRWYKEMDSLKAKGVGDASNNKTISLIMEKWHRDLVDSIKQELVLVEQEMKKNKSKANDKYSKERRDYGVFLRCMQPETLAAITVMHVIQIFTRSGIQKGVKVPIMVTGIGKEIQHELIAQKVLAQNPEDHKRRDAIKKIFENRHGRNGSMRFKKLMKENEMLMDADTFWPVNVSAKVGSVLMRLFFDTAKVAVPQVDPKTKEQFMFMEPAFQHSYEIDRGRKFGVLHTHPEISRKLVRDKPSVLQVRHMPMLSEPKAWTGYQDGGFLGHPSQIMRCSPGDGLQKAYIKKALEDDGLPEIRTSLDILGKTAWTINDAVFAVMKEAWNTGEEFPNIPPLDPNLPKPSPPKDDSPAEQAYYNKQLRDLENTVSALHSQRCFMNFQMEIAQAYLNETFFLPHNMDFRGRAYPVPAYLNQMGADNARGLLLFKKARPLGKSGLSWLKVHIANVFGFDKASFQEREGFTDKHLDDVLDSANNGLHGRRWFFQAEDPWQCLSACLELRNALRLEDPTQYMSRLPIHQDGSCNGLQHYAALGGDLQGAQHVNLEPGERPKDIYTGVCDLVIEQLAKDAANGNELAKSLEGKMKRKIVKQTVMTNVYGVTFIGAIRQVRRQLIAHYPDLPDMSASSIYITRAIFNALGSLFSGAHSIQYWLGDCASRICQSLSPFQLDELAKRTLSEAKDQNVRNEEEQDEEEMEEEEEQFEMNPVKMFRAPVIWTSPLGLPVVQPYRTVKCRRVYTSLQSLNLQQDDGGVGGVVSKRKQLQAFPPNFIHSLDATHMMLSALECDRRGLTFAAVHDSFWTHAGDVDTMNSALREAFIRMHSDNVTKRLAAEFKVRYDGYLFLAKIPAKSPIAVKIVQTRRKNKSTMLSEVVLEYQRQTLLRSDDPEMQAQGRAMTTGASIFEEMNGTNDDIAIPSTLGETATGAINEERKESGRVYSSVDEKDPAIASLFTDLDPQFLEFETTKTDDESEPKAAEEGAAPKRNAPNKFTWTWLPLTFRDVPAKGEFDVNRLRDSKYFFS